MKMIKLNGEYKLYAYKKEKAPMRPQDITGESISAIVPGNVEID